MDAPMWGRRTIAEQGRGHYYFAENAQALGTLFTEELQSVIVPVATDLQLRLQAGSGESIEAVYGVPDAAQGQAQFGMDELNADDWRIVLVETQVHDSSAKPVNFSATLRWRPVGAIPDSVRECLLLDRNWQIGSARALLRGERASGFASADPTSVRADL